MNAYGSSGCAELEYKGYIILVDNDRLGSILVEMDEPGCWLTCFSMQEARAAINRRVTTGCWFRIH